MMRQPPADHLGDPVGQASAWNLANALTVVRLVLVPVFVLVAVSGFEEDNTSRRLAATGVFLVAALTDLVDGEVARRRHLITNFGKILDPIADKALTGAALIVLSSFHALPWWVTVVIVAREIFVTSLRFWVIEHGVIPASRGGKVKTGLQILAISLYLLPLGSSAAGVRAAVMALALMVTVGTGVDYVVRAMRLRRAALAVTP
jgi:CDP-diacylglycerol--glycerol-3-phosphate 3-phosphatidyltransferase